jgi:hypothetical protein
VEVRLVDVGLMDMKAVAGGKRTAKSPATKSASLHKGSPSGRTSTSARRSRPWSSEVRLVDVGLMDMKAVAGGKSE